MEYVNSLKLSEEQYGSETTYISDTLPNDELPNGGGDDGANSKNVKATLCVKKKSSAVQTEWCCFFDALSKW